MAIADNLKPPTASSEPGRSELVALLAMLMALQALAIDAMLPALGDIAHELQVADPNHRQLVVGVYLIASGLGALFPGALADRFGRRPVIFVGLGCYVVLSAACALVRNFDTLLVLRVLQALSAAGLSVVPNAIVRDRLSGDAMARAMSLISVVFMIVPMLAPSVGQAVMLLAGWRWVFGGMALLGLVMALWSWRRLPETLNPMNRQTISPAIIAGNMIASLTNRAAIGYVLGGALMSAAIFSYINSSQQLIAEHFGAGALFPVLFAVMAAAMALANFTNSRIVERFGARRVSHAALLAFIAVSVAQVWSAYRPHQQLWDFIPLMALNMGLVGFTGANFGSIALQPFARIAGSAASVQMFLRMALGAVAGAVVGQAYDGTARPLAWALLIYGLIALALVLFSEKGRLFRRLNPPTKR